MHPPFQTAIVLIVTTGALAAEVSTSTFLKRCEQASRCENEIYLILDGDPALNTEYRCLFEADGPPLPSRLLNWLQTNKSQSEGDLLEDLYSALDALRAENLHGSC
jgi:hypothetical protein